MTHKGLKQFKCEECEMGFNYKPSLECHKLTHKSSLEQQKLIHEGLKSFMCDKCEKCFRSKSHLIMHHKYHND